MNIKVWTDHTFTSTENMESVLLPINDITKYLYYTHPVSNRNQRMIVSALTENPIVWNISKVATHAPIGIIKIGLSQDTFNLSTDYVNLETGEMYADYYTSEITPTDPTEPTPTPSSNYSAITASTSTIKIGGSYKTLTMTIYDESGMDITDSYSNAVFNWTYSISGVRSEELSKVITWLDGTTFNKKKIKFSNDRSYLEKMLEITCEVSKDNKTPIVTTMKFELII